MSREITFGNTGIGGSKPLLVVAGPCVIENIEILRLLAKELKSATSALGLGFVFKASYDKANRTSIHSYRGPGREIGLEMLREVRNEFDVPIISDIHGIDDIEPAAQVLDVIQIPAFLCRQTDLLVEAARSGKPINIKKGQFLSPWDIAHIIEKVTAAGCDQLTITERGTTFGYQNLVVDMRSFPIMRSFGFPIIFDATHSVQLPGGGEGCSGGNSEFVPPLARAAVAAGVDGVFMEVHPKPAEALCDGPNSLSLDHFSGLVRQLHKIDLLVKEMEGDNGSG